MTSVEKCPVCKEKSSVKKSLLSCNHFICHNCIDKLMNQKFGDDLSIIQIDKKQI